MTTIQLLLDNIPEIALYASNEMVSPLHIVAEQGRVDALEALIKAGALLNLQDFDGDTPLHDAVKIIYIL